MASIPDANNVVRTTLEALAAILGGTQSLHTNSRDEALALPSEESVRLALRTQQIIAHETGIPEVVDPLAGSTYVEELTDRLEEETLAMIAAIDELGGAVAAIEQGYQAEEIARAAYKTQRAIESQEQIIVGVNRYEADEPAVESLMTIDPASVKAQLERLRKVKAERSAGEVRRVLDGLKTAAQGNANLLPHILDCVRVYATLGEVSDSLREVFGEYHQ